jgi:rSAM/selenodomain-associated transferase 1
MTKTVAVGIFGKTPAAGYSKTRLSPPLTRDECGALAACFIRDIAATIDAVTAAGGHFSYAVYTPRGSEADMRALLPARFHLLLQCEGDFGLRLQRAIEDLFALGHSGVILVNSDSPTLPGDILQSAIEALTKGAAVVLSPAFDGGYTLIGLSRPDARLFDRIPWSTPDVYRCTMERAKDADIPVVEVAPWYDVDDATSLRMLAAELANGGPPFAQARHRGAEAPATRAFLRGLRLTDQGGPT